MSVERDVVDLFRAVLMKDRVGDELEGAISGVAQHGFYTRLDDPFVEALSPVERLEEDHFELDELGIRLVGRRTQRTYGLGDRLRVRLVDVNVSRREIVAVPLGGPADGKGADEKGATRPAREGRPKSRQAARPDRERGPKSRRRKRRA
jgi:ribonuclease R